MAIMTIEIPRIVKNSLFNSQTKFICDVSIQRTSVTGESVRACVQGFQAFKSNGNKPPPTQKGYRLKI